MPARPSPHTQFPRYFLLMALILCSVPQVSFAESFRPGLQRESIPPEDQINVLQTEITQQLEGFARSTTQSSSLHQTFARLLTESRQQAAPQAYASLRILMEKTYELDQPDLTIRSLYELMLRFEIDVREIENELSLYTRRTPIFRARDRYQLYVDQLDRLLLLCVIHESWGTARDVLSAENKVARKYKDQNLNERNRELATLIMRVQKIAGELPESWRDRIQIPLDSKETSIGRYLAFVEGDWPSACQSLSQTEVPVLAELAGADLAHPESIEEQIQLAKDWLQYAKESDEEEFAIRSLYWCEIASEKTSPLQKVVVEGIKNEAHQMGRSMSYKSQIARTLGGMYSYAPTEKACEKEFREGDLNGDTELGYLDVTHASLRNQGAQYELLIETAGEIPKVSAVPQKLSARYLFYLDLDNSLNTGQYKTLGNDRTIVIELSNAGWQVTMRDSTPLNFEVVTSAFMKASS